ncbi:hypothetical protein NPIL_13691 [Nephila pilipes]|uniref:Uncharacterized protein n=1 Tax=Nephila pilipes TaxID=299642 RepID=A0A8X6TFK3_NEPPI|nr:hypothetical protein NPIL_13691 [Nephila pilipes]
MFLKTVFSVAEEMFISENIGTPKTEALLACWSLHHGFGIRIEKDRLYPVLFAAYRLIHTSPYSMVKMLITCICLAKCKRIVRIWMRSHDQGATLEWHNMSKRRQHDLDWDHFRL